MDLLSHKINIWNSNETNWQNLASAAHQRNKEDNAKNIYAVWYELLK